jgi:hypothetical protein
VDGEDRVAASQRQPADLADLYEVEGEGLLAEDVEAALERFDHERGVGVGWRGDVDEVELGLRRQRGSEIVVGTRAGKRGQRSSSLRFGRLDDGRDLEAGCRLEAGQVRFGSNPTEADDRTGVLLHR